MPGLQHGAVFGDLILAFACALQGVGVDILEADEHAVYAGSSCHLNEAAHLVSHGVDLSDDIEALSLNLAHFDQAVEDRFPVLIARQVVVGDEEIVHALSDIRAHDIFDVVSVAAARFASLHIDDSAEPAQERTAAAGVEAGAHAGRTAYDIER